MFEFREIFSFVIYKILREKVWVNAAVTLIDQVVSSGERARRMSLARLEGRLLALNLLAGVGVAKSCATNVPIVSSSCCLLFCLAMNLCCGGIN